MSVIIPRLEPGQRFYKTEKSRTAYRYLGGQEGTFFDMSGLNHYTIWKWVREDWAGKIEEADSMSFSGQRMMVWIEE